MIAVAAFLIGVALTVYATHVFKPRLIPEPDKPQETKVAWLGYATAQAPVQDSKGKIKLQHMTFSNVVIGVRSDGVLVWVSPNNQPQEKK